MPNSALKSISSVPSCGGLISRLAYARARRDGAAIDGLLRQAGLTDMQMQDGHARMSVAGQIRFLELVAEAVGDGDLGFNLARDFNLRELGLLYYVGASAETLGQALARVERYSVIINEGVRLKITNGQTFCVAIQYHGVARHTDRHQIEFWITAIIRLCRDLTGRDLTPVRVLMMHHRPENEFGLRIFAGGNIETNAEVDEVHFPAASFDIRLASTDPHLHRMTVECCEEVLARRETRSSLFRVRVENAIAPLLAHGPVNADAVAAALGVSPRTLARRLASENVTFAQVLRALRSELAHRYLADRQLQISQIAWLLGYTDVGAFTHAFRRWTGTTPTAARMQSARPAARVIGPGRRRPAARAS